MGSISAKRLSPVVKLGLHLSVLSQLKLTFRTLNIEVPAWPLCLSQCVFVWMYNNVVFKYWNLYQVLY